MAYADGYLVPVPADRREAFTALGRRSGAILGECGARRLIQCWIDGASGDDSQFHGADARDNLATRPADMVTSFSQARRTAPGEVVVLCWPEWPDQAARDRGLAAAMADPTMQVAGEAAISDGRRIVAYGFIPIVEL